METNDTSRRGTLPPRQSWINPDGRLNPDGSITYSFEEITYLHNLLVVEDGQIIREILDNGLPSELRPELETAIKHARDAAKGEEVFEEYLDRIGVELTKDEKRVSRKLLDIVHWKQAFANSKASREVQPQSSLRRDAMAKGVEKPDPQQSNVAPGEKTTQEAAWEAAARNGFPLPERRDGTIFDATVKPSAEQAALFHQLFPEQARQLWIILRFAYETMDGVDDAPDALKKAGIKSTDRRIRVVVNAVIRLMGDTFSPLSLGDFWSAIEPSERAAILAVKV